MIGFANTGITCDNLPAISNFTNVYAEEDNFYEGNEKALNSVFYLSENDLKKIIARPITKFGISLEQKLFLEKQKKHLRKIQQEGDSWSEENITGPNSQVISKVETIINELANFGIFSDRITQTVEEGICMVFFNANQTMFFEIYNDGEFGYIIEDRTNKQILKNENVPNIKVSIEKISLFFHLNYEISKTTY